jgi:hypothetical protein
MMHPLIGITADHGIVPDNAGNAPLINKDRRRVPSYVSGRSFSRALLNLIVPDSRGETTMTQIQAKLNDPNTGIPDQLRTALQALANDAAEDVAKFRTSVAAWYDDQMSRVAGWYKRHVRWVSLGLGALLAVAFNLNVLSIARSLYTDQALQGSLVTQASQAARCQTTDPATCLRQLRSEVDTIRGAGLPIGWSTVSACGDKSIHCNWFQRRGLWGPPGRSAVLQIADVALLLVGWTIMVIALLPGARFWFDSLSKLGSLRSTGPKPSASTPSSG